MKALARIYRPTTFEEVCGQKSIIKILERQLETNKIKNCYLFSGQSGTGKTTLGKILANRINKSKGSPIEIDAASNNSVDNVRSIISEAQTRAIDSEYKVIIIDECHSITAQGWQAFLKTLEEPPEKTIFIFCTTNPEKVPATIQNRVMRFNLTKVPLNDIKNRLEYICEKEGFTNYRESCDYISKISNGGMRDAIAYIDKVADYSSDLSIENTLEVLGNYSYNDFLDLTNSIVDSMIDINNEQRVLSILENLDASGKDMKNFVDQYMSFVLDLIKYTLFKDMSVTKLPLSLEEKIKYAVSFEGNLNIFNNLVDKLLTLKNQIRYDSNPALSIKVSFVQIIRG
jgi:DNA polymerase III subunit gamma/tau